MSRRPARLPLFVLLVTVLVFCLIAFSTYRHLETSQRLQAGAQVTAHAKLKLDLLDAWLDERRADIAFSSRNSYTGRHFEQWVKAKGRAPELETAIRQRMGMLLDLYGYSLVALYDSQGRERLRVGGEGEPVSGHGADALAAMRQGKPVMVDFHRHAGQPIQIGFIAPLRLGGEHDGRTVGAMFLAMDAQAKLFPWLRRWPLVSSSGETSLAWREGRRLVLVSANRSSVMSVAAPTAPSDRISARILRSETGLLRDARDDRGAAVLAYAQAVRGTPWILIAKQDLDEVDAPLRQAARWLVFATVFLVSVASVLAGLWGWNLRMRERTHRLSHQLELAAQQRLAQEALAESEAKYRVLADYAVDWEYWRAPEGGFIYVSPACEAISGYPAADFLNDPELMERIIHPDDRPQWDEHLRAPDTPGQPHSHLLTLRIHSKSGEERWIEHTCTCIHDATGRFLGRRGGNRDVTERRRMEAELHRSLSFEQTILDSVAANIAVLDPRGRIIAVNAPWRRFALENGLQATGQATCTDIGCDYLATTRASSGRFSEGAREAAEGIEAVLDGRTDFHYVEYPCNAPDVPRWFSMTVTPLPEGAGAVVAHVEITERVAAMAELRARNEELERFNHAMVDRENVMIDLKQRINALTRELGGDPPYTMTDAQARGMSEQDAEPSLTPHNGQGAPT